MKNTCIFVCAANGQIHTYCMVRRRRISKLKQLLMLKSRTSWLTLFINPIMHHQYKCAIKVLRL